MDPEAFFEPEVAVAVAVTATLSSARARKVMRTGAVYGIAGILKASNAIKLLASDMQQRSAATAGLNEEVSEEAKAERPTRPTAPRRAGQAAKHGAEPEAAGVP